jgi:hypothetical protein
MKYRVIISERALRDRDKAYGSSQKKCHTDIDLK